MRDIWYILLWPVACHCLVLYQDRALGRAGLALSPPDMLVTTCSSSLTLHSHMHARSQSRVGSRFQTVTEIWVLSGFQRCLGSQAVSPDRRTG